MTTNTQKSTKSNQKIELEITPILSDDILIERFHSHVDIHKSYIYTLYVACRPTEQMLSKNKRKLPYSMIDVLTPFTYK